MQYEPKWIVPFLKFAGFYNLAWGVFIFNKPLLFYQALNEQVSHYPSYLPWLGVLVGLLGWAYLWAAVNPHKYWYLVSLGWLSKAGGVLGGDWLLLADVEPKFWGFAMHIIFNDLLWIIPFAWASYRLYRLSK
ncbi:MAG: hypothetical protein MUE85_21795 [Microscillaceae bacterium]|jgi:hypothetical protein|nr:hypothetical protein [Microscillaceae bacterium]